MLFLSTTSALAMNDLERGIGFVGNFASGGTYQAQTEVAIQAMRIEFAERKEKYDIQMIQAYQAEQAKILSEEKEFLKQTVAELGQQREELQRSLEDDSKIEDLTEKIYRGQIKRRAVIGILRTNINSLSRAVKACQVADVMRCPSNDVSHWDQNDVADLFKSISMQIAKGKAIISELDLRITADQHEISQIEKHVSHLIHSTGEIK